MTPELVTTREGAARLRARLFGLRAREAFGFDTESSGPLLPKGRMINVHRSELTGFAFAFADGYRCYVPVAHAWGNLVEDEVHNILETLGVTRGMAVVHGLKHEYHVAHRARYALPESVLDTMLLAWMQDRPAPGKKPYALKSLARHHLGEEPRTFEEVARGRQWRDVPPEEAVVYAPDDAGNALALREAIGDLPTDHPLYQTEIPFALALANMERRGVWFNVDEAFEMSAVLASAQKAAMEEWVWTYPSVSPSSGQQLQAFFGGIWGTDGVNRTKKTGLFSTSAATMEALMRHPDSTPAGRRAAELRLLTAEGGKLLGTYLTPMPVFASLHADGRIRPDALQQGTRTGRISMKDPTLQNIPVRTELGRRIMALFQAAAGCTLVGGDYAQVELVVLAHYAGKGRLLNALRAGVDLHEYLGERVGIDRASAKTLQYAHIYGSGPKKLAAVMHSTVDEAKEKFAKYRALFPEVPRAVERAIQAARGRGYARTMGGRVRRLPDIDSSDWRLRSAAERVAMNTPIQGAAGYITKLAMLRCEKVGLPCILQVHDSIVVEVPEAEAYDARVALRDAMQGAIELAAPLLVDVKVGRTMVDVK